jgi:NADP-dependent 3-hydroxy acid dehydrogenase YdfG
MSATYSRIAIITGTTSGIGEATAKKFIAEGYAVVGSGRNSEKLQALKNELGDAFAFVAGEAWDQSVIDNLFAEAQIKFGRAVDLVVVNAGRGLGGSVKDASLVEFDELLKVNITGALKLMQKAAQEFTCPDQLNFPTKAKDIVVLGSVVGRSVSPFSAVYGSSKFAVHSLAEALRREICGQGVRVTLVEPGIVISGFQAVAGYSDQTVNGFHERFGPLLVSEDVADAIYHTVSLPAHIHISDLVIRPTRQDYP